MEAWNMRSIPAAIVLGLAAGMAAAGAAPSCFSACLSETDAAPDDERAWRDAARTCKARCEVPVRADLARRGVLARLETCRSEAIGREELRKLRAANPSFQMRFNVFTWEIRNVLEGKVLRSIAVASPNLSLQEARYSAAALIPPGESGTFVIPDFYDGYPALRYSTKVIEIGACPID